MKREYISVGIVDVILSWRDINMSKERVNTKDNKRESSVIKIMIYFHLTYDFYDVSLEMVSS